MKIDFKNLNIEPMPNPKPLKVVRVSVGLSTEDGNAIGSGFGLIVNADIHPHRDLVPAHLFGAWAGRR